jgi:hypothetical protein
LTRRRNINPGARGYQITPFARPPHSLTFPNFTTRPETLCSATSPHSFNFLEVNRWADELALYHQQHQSFYIFFQHFYLVWRRVQLSSNPPAILDSSFKQQTPTNSSITNRFDNFNLCSLSSFYWCENGVMLLSQFCLIFSHSLYTTRACLLRHAPHPAFIEFLFLDLCASTWSLILSLSTLYRKTTPIRWSPLLSPPVPRFARDSGSCPNRVG